MARMIRALSNSEAAPVTTRSPSRRMVMRSATSSASSSACVMKTIEWPSRRSRRTNVKKWSFSSGVRVAVGSSKMITLALLWTARAISTICFLAAPSVETRAVGSTWKLSPCRNCCASM